MKRGSALPAPAPSSTLPKVGRGWGPALEPPLVVGTGEHPEAGGPGTRCPAGARRERRAAPSPPRLRGEGRPRPSGRPREEPGAKVRRRTAGRWTGAGGSFAPAVRGGTPCDGPPTPCALLRAGEAAEGRGGRGVPPKRPPRSVPPGPRPQLGGGAGTGPPAAGPRPQVLSAGAAAPPAGRLAPVRPRHAGGDTGPAGHGPGRGRGPRERGRAPPRPGPRRGPVPPAPPCAPVAGAPRASRPQRGAPRARPRTFNTRDDEATAAPRLPQRRKRKCLGPRGATSGDAGGGDTVASPEPPAWLARLPGGGPAAGPLACPHTRGGQRARPIWTPVVGGRKRQDARGELARPSGLGEGPGA